MSAANTLLARGDRALRARAGDVLTITKNGREYSVTAIVSFDVVDNQGEGLSIFQLKQASRILIAASDIVDYRPEAGDVFVDEDDLTHAVMVVRRMGPNWELDCAVNS